MAQGKSNQTVRPPQVENVRFWSFGNVTRVAIVTHGDYRLTSHKVDSPARLFFDLKGRNPVVGRQRGVHSVQVGDKLVHQIRIAETLPGVTRVVFDLEVPVEFISSQLANPDRLMIEIRGKGSKGNQDLKLARSRTGQRSLRFDGSSEQVAAMLHPRIPPFRYEPFPVLYGLTPFLASVDQRALDAVIPKARSIAPLIAAKRSKRRTPVASSQTRKPEKLRTSPAIVAAVPKNSETEAAALKSNSNSPAEADSNGNRSLVRVFGLKLARVVIDAGHGGHDTGTIGPGGLMEKDLVLDVALRLGRMLEQRLGSEVVYTRNDDVFVPLESRTQIANRERADLFISIHANSSPASAATGVETYYFNFTSDKNALDLATRENAASQSSIHDLQDLLKKAVLKAKVEESREFAQRVQTSLFGASTQLNEKSKDRGIRRAPFVVLIGATMPSILTEIGFVSNPHDEKLLRKAPQRERIAEALYKGVSGYASTLSHVQFARIRPTGNN